jgi:hypothetical protein
MQMNRINTSLSAFALAVVIISTSCVTERRGVRLSKEVPVVHKQVAFHVDGMMKTASGAT